MDTGPLDDERRRAAAISLAVGGLVLAAKLLAWQFTGSTAVYSDALESIVNVVAASLLLMSLVVATRPADRDHPYGHGKAEFLSAGVEGSLIFVAAVLIFIEAGRDLVLGPELAHLDTGLWVLVIVSGVNAALGAYLVRTGRRTGSLALLADGKHVLTDVWTSGGVIVGLAAVWATGLSVLDPLTALAVSVNILRQGWALIRQALAGLMDEASPEALEQAAKTLEAERRETWIDVHGLREWRSGDVSHVDLHLVVPRYLDVDAVHGEHEELKGVLRSALGENTETVVHFDPCRPAHCPGCGVQACAIRAAAFRGRSPVTPERATRPLDPATD